MDQSYYMHKNNPSLICEVFAPTNTNRKFARFGKWKWNGNICIEEYTFKEVNDGFETAFKEITQKQFNLQWGINLSEA